MHDEMVEYMNEEGDVFLFEQGEWWWLGQPYRRSTPGDDDTSVDCSYMTGYGWAYELSSFNRWRGEKGFAPIPPPVKPAGCENTA